MNNPTQVNKYINQIIKQLKPVEAGKEKVVPPRDWGYSGNKPIERF